MIGKFYHKAVTKKLESNFLFDIFLNNYVWY